MFGVAVYEVNTFSNFGSPPLYFDIQQLRLRPVRGLDMFHMALYEVHTVPIFGGPPLYSDMRQHRDAILEGDAASSVQPPCGLSVCSI